MQVWEKRRAIVKQELREMYIGAFPIQEVSRPINCARLSPLVKTRVMISAPILRYMQLRHQCDTVNIFLVFVLDSHRRSR